MKLNETLFPNDWIIFAMRKRTVFLMKRILGLCLLLLGISLSAQEQLKVMHYNLLNFGVFSNYCTLENNNPSEKIDGLKTMADHYLPDLLVVNEMSPSVYYHDLLLDEVLNTSGRNYYARAVGTNQAGAEIVNMLYYHSGRIGLADQDVIGFWLRDINVYKLFHNHPGLSHGADTVFFYVISAHFKAGSSGPDKNIRAQMAGSIMDYLSDHDIVEACLLTGDLNLQNNLEPAWEILTSGYAEDYLFTDPTGLEGIWHNNADFSLVHTQSTHTASDGCKAIGGMDDRFDFILINDTIAAGNGPLRFLEGSYETPGQDGQRFNSSLINPPNYNAPADVIEAMYNASDHLPVIVTLELDEIHEQPEGWEYTETIDFHTLIIPANVQPELNLAPLSSGSFIGAFFTDGQEEHCAGHSIYDGVSNITILAWGDVQGTPEKEGFYPDEPIIFKVYDRESETAFYADPDFDSLFPQYTDRWQINGLCGLTALDAAYLQFHPIEIDEGWNTVSSFLVPKWKTVQSVFGDHLEEVQLLTNGTDFYYPQGGLNTLEYWTSNTTLVLKTASAFTITVEGLPVDEIAFGLNEGWNPLPVPVPCYVLPSEISISPPGNFKAIKSIAGSKVYWPDHGVFTLDLLIPGNVYLINVSDESTVYFENCQ